MAEGKYGRPPVLKRVLQSETVKTSFRLQAEEMDALCRAAITNRTSINLYVREVLRRHLGVFVGKT